MTDEQEPRRPFWVDAVLLVCAGLVFVTLVGLGIWQVQRLAWKLDLIEAVEARAFAEPATPPTGPVTDETHAYLRIETSGTYRHDLSKRVKAVTELGPGHWLMTPMRTTDGYLWVNRGFLPLGEKGWTTPSGVNAVEGLLRISEPDGTLLERNRPDISRWVSRDVSALSDAAGLSPALPYFVDADHQGAPSDWPRGGLTQLSFRNKHLSYAITWFAMAALFLAGMAYVIHDRLRSDPEARHVKV